MSSAMDTRASILEAFLRKGPPDPAVYLSRVDAAAAALDAEGGPLRPFDSLGKPGGLVRLEPSLPTIILPDLHARVDFLISVLFLKLPGGQDVLTELGAGSLQILCLGDGFHAESRALSRWRRAYGEYLGGFRTHEAMDEEMRESLGLMEMVMLCMSAFPRGFHFLKGNHENILNEEGEGNHPFGKFADEGSMVRDYVLRFYGEEFLRRYSGFEKRLPFFAVGHRFLASHAEPLEPYTEKALIDARLEPEVMLGLTWTDNGAADPLSVPLLLERFHPNCPKARYFTGHRTIRGTYRERSEGRHLQIHNPDRFIAAWIVPHRDFDPDLDIGEIRDISSLIQESMAG